MALSNSLNPSAATTWEAYANSWRITGDVEYYHNSVYPLTLILGTDLTSNVDSYDYSLLHNNEVIAVDQAGVQAAPVVDYFNSDPSGTEPETWRAKEADSSFTILVSNPTGNTQTGTTAWSLFGIPGPVIVRNLWSGANLIGTPNQDGGYQIPEPLAYNLAAYQSELLKLTPMVPVTQYLVDGPNSKLLARLCTHTPILAATERRPATSVTEVRSCLAMFTQQKPVPTTSQFSISQIQLAPARSASTTERR